MLRDKQNLKLLLGSCSQTYNQCFLTFRGGGVYMCAWACTRGCACISLHERATQQQIQYTCSNQPLLTSIKSDKAFVVYLKFYKRVKKWLPLANFRITRFWNLESYFSTIKKTSSWLQKHLYYVYVLVSVVWNRETLWLRVIKAPHVHCQNQYKSIATYWGQSADSIFTVQAIILNHTKFNCKKTKRYSVWVRAMKEHNTWLWNVLP